MAHDPHFGIRVAAQAGGKLVQHGRKSRADVRAAHGEGDVAGNVELELVVCGLCHTNTGALGSGLHVAPLLFQVGRPDVGAQGTHAGTYGSPRACMATGGGADQRSGHCAHTCAGGGVFLGFGHVRAAGQEQRSGGHGNKRLVHGGLLL